jgi:hypothetical protein
MIKGWKNNPAWVKHYAEVGEIRFKARVEKFRIEAELEGLERQLKSSQDEAKIIWRYE